jgi:hypothetical protein
MPWRVAIEFKPEDLWVGVFWRHHPTDERYHYPWNIWICALPMLPINITLWCKECGEGMKDAP